MNIQHPSFARYKTNHHADVVEIYSSHVGGYQVKIVSTVLGDSAGRNPFTRERHFDLYEEAEEFVHMWIHDFNLMLSYDPYKERVEVIRAELTRLDKLTIDERNRRKEWLRERVRA